MLEKVGNWNFDIFLFDRLTNGEFTFVVSFVVSLALTLWHVIACLLNSTDSIRSSIWVC